MVPHKIERGKAALRRIKLFEGIPPPYDKRKRVVVPTAMRVLCLKPGRAYCHLGRLSSEVGWKYKDVVRALETKRKVRAVLDIRKRNSLKVSNIFGNIYKIILLSPKLSLFHKLLLCIICWFGK